MEDRMTGRGNVFVTGAAGGVGRELVRQLLERGYGVIASVLNDGELESLRDDGLAAASLFVADLGAPESALTTMREALAQAQAPLEAAIGCAGINPCGPLETTPIGVFSRTVEINAGGNLAVYQAALPHLRQSGGRLILVSSLSGKVALPLLGHYTASKFALEGLADTMRLEAGQWGVPVSLVEPGAISTSMTNGFGEQLDAQFAQLDAEGRDHYAAYFDQQKAFAAGASEIAQTADVVATAILDVLEADDPEPRYSLGSAVDFLAQRHASSDRAMDAMLNQFLPGLRSTATA